MLRPSVILLFTVAVTFVLLRWIAGGCESSHFIVAGSKSVDASVANIKVAPGYSFDGVYFYRYALAPFNTENPYGGITVSTPAYRHQRIFYPLVTWLLALGGTPSLVPWMLIVVNLLFFMLYVAGVKKLLLQEAIHPRYLIITVLIPGVWMALSRDLAEVTEICLFVYVLLAYRNKHTLMFLALATAMMFTRETSAIALAALAVMYLLRSDRWKHKAWLACIIAPVALFSGYKMWLTFRYGDISDTGGFNLNIIPLKGIYDGFRAQWNLVTTTGARGAMVLLFSFAQFAIIAVTFFKTRSQQTAREDDLQSWMRYLIIMWLLLCPFLSVRIWETDWGFARALTIPFFCALFIMVRNGKLSNHYLIAAGTLQVLLLARLIVKT